MGGLVGLYYVKRMGGRRRVRRLVMLGTPTPGTWSALLGVAVAPFGRASLQLLPDSPFLRELDEGPLPEGVEIVSIAGERDRLAPPARRRRLDGVRHISRTDQPRGAAGRRARSPSWWARSWPMREPTASQTLARTDVDG